MDKRLEQYLREVDRRLSYMPVSEKTDILGELKSGFTDMLADGKSPEEILSLMGPAKALAAAYLGEAVERSAGFSWRKLWLTLGFYSLASAAWLVVIPTLASLALGFVFSSVVSAAAGVLGCIKPYVDFPLARELQFVFFTHELVGLPALLAGLVLAVVFWLLGLLFWKLTRGTLRMLGQGRHRLRHGE